MIERKLEDLFLLMEDVGRSIHSSLCMELRRLSSPATAKQMFICASMCRCGGRVTVTDLAREMGVSLSASTVAAKRMNKLGLLQRFRDKIDRRVVWLELTAEGAAGVAFFSVIQKQVMQMYFTKLSAEELECLYRIYPKLYKLTKNALAPENDENMY